MMMIFISEMLTLTLIMQQILLILLPVPSYYVPTHASAGKARPK